MSRILFVTDSAADIPAPLCRQYGIQVLPFPLIVEDQELDSAALAPEEFYKTLSALPAIPTHAQLTPYLFQECFERAWEQGYDHLIYTAINSGGSATHQNALQAREAFYQDVPQARDTFEISIVDSKSYTMAYGWAVLEGAKMAQAGKPARDIVAFLQDWVDHARILFVPFDLKFAKKSGRISAAAAFVGEALGLKPIMTFEDGVSKTLAKVRGDKAVVPALMKLAAQERDPEAPYLLIRADNPAQADALKRACQTQFGCDPALEYFLGPIIAVNAGPNLTGLVYRRK